MIFIIMGVSGSGKTTVGKMLADRLGCKFYDADHFHSEDNIEKMGQGVALSDADRQPWLISIHRLIKQQKTNTVIACSALKQSYRDILDTADKEVFFIYLKGDKEVLTKRLLERKGHYAGDSLLDSQLEVLEEPKNTITFDIINDPKDIVEGIMKQFDL